jgi:hypothetical protein
MENKAETVGELLLKYITDKNHGTIKNIYNNLDDRIIVENAESPIGHTYGKSYQEIFDNFDKDQEINFMEIGIQRGGSVMAWREYFPNANIYGIDIIDAILPEYKRDDVTYIFKDINDSSVKEQLKDIEFDIIIDDGSHRLWDIKPMVKTYLPQLRTGGFMVIEDCLQPEAYLRAMKEIVPEGYSVTPRDLRGEIPNGGYNYLIVIQKD